MYFPVIPTIWNGISQEYERDLLLITPHDSTFQSGVKQICNFTRRSCIVIAGVVCGIATPIFLLLDVTYQLLCYEETGQLARTVVVPYRMDSIESQREHNESIFIEFYHNHCKNSNEVRLQDIWNYSHADLERHHNFIQWLFPNNRVSGPYPAAPLATDAIQTAFLNNMQLRMNMKHSFEVMLNFYGFERNYATGVITKGANFAERSRNWMTPGNHNFQRLARMLKSLSMLGSGDEAKALYTALESLYLDDHKHGRRNQSTSILAPNHSTSIPRFLNTTLALR